MLLKIVQGFLKYTKLHSLRARIFLIMLVVGSVPSFLMRYGIVNNYEERAVQHRITTIQSQLHVIANHLITRNYLTNYLSTEPHHTSSREVIEAELEMLSNLYDGRVQIIDESLRIIRDTYAISEGKWIVSEEVIRGFHGESLSNYNQEQGYIEILVPITETVDLEEENGTETVVRGVMFTSITNDSIVATKEVLNRNAGILQTIMIMIIIGMAFSLSSALLKPFNRVTEAINEVQAGYSQESISVPDYAETIHIVDAFNQLLYRMKALDDSRQEFVANVSHELRTPLTSMKVLADSLLSQEEAPIELYREFLQDILSEIERETRTITDLLALVKMDKKAQTLNIASININDLTELVLKRLRPIARKKDVEVVFESLRPVVAEVDEVKMTLILSNLVENSIKYNNDHGWVKVLLDADHQSFTLEVSDSGIGIPEEDLIQIYERFYRVDKSHSRDVGGTGLGLAIARSAVLLHRGSITVTSTEGLGSSFKVKIPLNHISGG